MATGLARIKEKLKNKEMVIGSHVGFREACFTELLGDVGFDLIWIDAEHGPLDRSEILDHIIAARAAGVASIVRVPWNDPVIVKNVLDMGADGIVFPMIRNAEEAELAVSSCVYPLSGIRGAGPRRANRYGLGDKTSYNEHAHENIWKIMQIEHIDNVTTLDEILKIDGVDGIVVGPNDFASSMGKLGKVRDTEVLAAYDKIGEIARKYDKVFGVSTGFDEKTIKEWLDRGITWMNLGFDFQYVLSAAQKTLEGAKKVLEGR
jgi:2-keto-3-deoxy-L-rhamnonate aldolase RhmA